MQKLKKVSPHCLEGDLGWQLRDAYAEATQEFDRYETRIATEWQNNITAELTHRLKQPLLVCRYKLSFLSNVAEVYRDPSFVWFGYFVLVILVTYCNLNRLLKAMMKKQICDL